MTCDKHSFLEVDRQPFTDGEDLVDCVCEKCGNAFEVNVPTGEAVGVKLDFIWPIEAALRAAYGKQGECA